MPWAVPVLHHSFYEGISLTPNLPWDSLRPCPLFLSFLPGRRAQLPPDSSYQGSGESKKVPLENPCPKHPSLPWPLAWTGVGFSIP